jgi:hypothetical protein
MPDDDRERISDATREAAERDAKAEHGAPQVPTEEEEAAAPDRAADGVGEAYGEYLDKAANQPGEGRIP